jgi:hypothetical protein
MAWVGRCLALLQTRVWWNSPLIWALMSMTTVLSVYLILAHFIVGKENKPWEPPTVIQIALILSYFVLVFGIPLISVIVTVATYPLNEKYLSRLVQAYISAMLLFALGYFILVANTDPDRAFDGITVPWVWRKPSIEGRYLDIELIFRSFVDCVYFSSVTITTLGFGDIRPTIWFSKLMVSAEALAGVGIVVVGIGRHFAGSASYGR